MPMLSPTNPIARSALPARPAEASRAIAVALVILAAGRLAGCRTGPGNYDDPVAKLMEKGESPHIRMKAARQLEREAPAGEQRIDALKKLVWKPGHPTRLREYAIDELIAHDEQKAKGFLTDAIILTDDWDAREHIITTAVERGWGDFVPALVRSYAQPASLIDDADRPEREAIRQLRPDTPVRRVIFNVFAEHERADVKQRAAAWALLVRLTDDRGELVKMLRSAEPDDALVADMQACWSDLRVIPERIETVTWLQMLRTEPYEAYWREASAAVDALGDEQRAGLKLRHLPTVRYLHRQNSAVLDRSRSALLGRLRRWLAGRDREGRTAGTMSGHPQTLARWREQLAWADLAVLHMARSLLADRRVVEAWFEQADADYADKSSEHGGLVRLDQQGEPYPFAYEPMMKRYDRAYYPPEELILDGYTALVHYHFHAHERDNADYAGPGHGDFRRIARTHRFHGLVLTTLGPDRMNVDYYQPYKTAIDLGMIER